MKSPGRVVLAVVFACVTGSVLAADGSDSQSGPKSREQMRERCKDNPQECRERMQQHAQGWFKRVDKDGDGSISREEAQASAPRLAEHFDEVDANHDGKVTPEELRAHHQAMREQHRAEHGGDSKQQ